MPVPLDDAGQRAAYWPIPLVRAIPAGVLAIVITFSADHSARLGLLSFGGFAVTTGVAVALLAWMRLRGVAARPYLVASGAISVALGVLAFAVTDGGIPALLLVLTAWAVLTGALELYIGVRARRRHAASTDWITVGAITLLAGAVFALLPPDVADEFTNADKTTGVLDSAVIAVGLLGAYAAIILVFLAIAGFSAKWGTTRRPVDAEGRA